MIKKCLAIGEFWSNIAPYEQPSRCDMHPNEAKGDTTNTRLHTTLVSSRFLTAHCCDVKINDCKIKQTV